MAGLKSEVASAAAAGEQAGRERRRKQVDAALDRSAGPDLPVRERNVLALTSGRLLVFSLGGLITPQPRKLQWDFPLDEVRWVSRSRLTTGAAMALRADIGLADGHVARLDFPRAAVKPGQALLQELHRRVPDRSA
ncbi:hypothetical protein [Streptomyces sp. NPDC056160]|uniref:hypothetical protein n=1 Tax=Streptomyces sp. NPDC056160 TaxID=3345731 RepID=UPI0035D72F78